MTRLLLFLIVLFSINCQGQKCNDVECRAKVFQNSLTQSNVDTILNYTLDCIGSTYRVDTCDFYHTYYLFWIQNESTFLQKFDGCNFYKAIPLDTINLLTFYVAQQKEIDQEMIYPPTYSKSKYGDTVITVEQTIVHTCFYQMNSLIKKKKTFKSVSEYDLSFQKFVKALKQQLTLILLLNMAAHTCSFAPAGATNKSSP